MYVHYPVQREVPKLIDPEILTTHANSYYVRWAQDESVMACEETRLISYYY